MTTTDRTRLRMLANAATPGKRTADDQTVSNAYGAGKLVRGHEWDGFDATVGDGHMEHDPAFLAATDPGTILELLDAAEQAEARLQAVRDALAQYVDHSYADPMMVVCDDCAEKILTVALRALDGGS